MPKGRKFYGVGNYKGGIAFAFDHNGAICKYSGTRWNIIWH